jgi:hypothetical protein
VSAALQIIQIGLGSNTAFAQQATALLGAGASVGVLMPWGRAQESEADHLGLIYMAKAGYHPSASEELWVRMEAASRAGQRPPEFLSTHPSEATRIKQIEGLDAGDDDLLPAPLEGSSGAVRALHPVRFLIFAPRRPKSPSRGVRPQNGPHPSSGNPNCVRIAFEI